MAKSTIFFTALLVMVCVMAVVADAMVGKQEREAVSWLQSSGTWGSTTYVRDEEGAVVQRTIVDDPSSTDWYAYDSYVLPDALVGLETAQGSEWYSHEGVVSAHTPALFQHFVTQLNNAFCGVASAITVFNSFTSLPGDFPTPIDPDHGVPYYTQKNFFNNAVEAVKPESVIAEEGLTLEEEAAVLSSHPLVEATAVHAADSSVEEFTATVTEVLQTQHKRIIVNYKRSDIGEEGGGHFSVIGARHPPHDEETEDAVLLFDVARWKYPPIYWVPIQTMFQGMQGVDSSSGKTRGYIVVEMLEGVDPTHDYFLDHTSWIPNDEAEDYDDGAVVDDGQGDDGVPDGSSMADTYPMIPSATEDDGGADGDGDGEEDDGIAADTDLDDLLDYVLDHIVLFIGSAVVAAVTFVLGTAFGHFGVPVLRQRIAAMQGNAANVGDVELEEDVDAEEMSEA